MRLVPALILLCGCGSVFDLEPVDPVAPPGADPCTAAATAPASIVLGGRMLDATNNAPLGQLTVDAQPGGVAMTDASGAFQIEVPTGGYPLYASLTASGLSGYPRHDIYYQRPFTEAVADASSKLLPSTSIDTLYATGRTPGRGTALLSLRDCAGNGLADAQLDLEPPATVVYQGGGTATDGTGVAYATDVEALEITVRGAITPFRFDMRADAMAIVYLILP